MSRSSVLSHRQNTGEIATVLDSPDVFPGTLASKPRRLQTRISDACNLLKETGGNLASVVEEQQRFQAFLAQLSATLINASANEVDELIEAALRQIVEILGIDRSGFAELAADGNNLTITHSYQLPGIPPIPRLILEEQLPWYTRKVSQGQTVRLSRLPDDLPAEAVFEQENYRQVGLKSELTIPVRGKGAVIGGIALASFHSYHDWPDALIQRLHLISDIFSNALMHKRADETLRAKQQLLQQTREDMRQLAVKLLRALEEERKRVAREMHDDWTQRLALVGLDMAKLENYLDEPKTALPLLRRMQEHLMRLSEDVHALSRQLHPSIVGDLGLVEALHSECVNFSRRERIAVHYRSQDVPWALPTDVALCVYRVAQEALRNLAKHAAVNEACVTLVATGSELLLRVQDQGIGFDTLAVRPEPGLGLSSMEERVRLIQAELSVISAPGSGTTVQVRVPLVRSDT